jgi:hypothetical protein
VATQRAEILTPWQEYTEEGLTYRAPLVTSEFSTRKYTDITGQDALNLIPAPNLVSVLIEADETVIAQVDADIRFFVLWEEYI